MANWSNLKSSIASIIKTNGNKGITGQLLQNALNNIISNVGANSSFAGIATPETNPGTPDGNVFYLATKAGTYSNFNGIVINLGEAVILEWRGNWVKKDSGFPTKEELSELNSKINTFSNLLIASKNFSPTSNSVRPAIGETLKAGVEYIVNVTINSPTGKFVNLKANKGNSGNAVDILLSDIYKNKGTYKVKYTPSVDVDRWYIEMASDYAITDTTSIDISVEKEMSVQGLLEEVKNVETELSNNIQNAENEIESVKKQLEDIVSGITVLSEKVYNPSVLILRPTIGTILKAGKKYTIQLDYSIETGYFVGLKANLSNSGEPIDTIKYDLYDKKGSYTIDYTPSVDVNYWYIYMASNYVYSENSTVSIKVYGEKEDDEILELPKIKRLEALDFNLAANESKSLSTNYAREKSMTCIDIDANGSFEEINLDYAGYANVTVNSTSVISSYRDGVTLQHQLPLSTAKRIAVCFERKTATKLVVKIIADGKVFVSSDISFFVFGGAKLTNNGSKSLHISSFSYCPSLIDNDIWFIGDSYVSAVDPNRWPYWLEQWGHSDVYIDGLSGGSSATMYSSLNADLKMYTPKYIVWCLGMNNADTESAINSSWLEYVQKVISLCKEKGITIILATIPSVPSRNNALKNEWVKNSGHRYIDFAKSVESDESGNWYDGLLHSDGVHPTEAGAKALAMQVLIDFVELTTK